MKEETDPGLTLDSTFRPPRIFMTFEAWQKIRAFTALCSVEINGFGFVKTVGNDLVIMDAFILPQTVSGTSADSDDDALHQFLYECVKRGGKIEDLRLQWHSHVRMPPYCSATDIDTIRGYQANLIISLVVNKFGEYHCRLDIFKPMRLGFEAEIRLILPDPKPVILDECGHEVKKKVKRRRIPVLDDLVEPIFGSRPVVETSPDLQHSIAFPLRDLEKTEVKAGEIR